MLFGSFCDGFSQTLGHLILGNELNQICELTSNYGDLCRVSRGEISNYN